jgi:hypothetical protein
LALDRDLMELLLILLTRNHIEPSKNRYRTSWATRRGVQPFHAENELAEIEANDTALLHPIPLNLLLR